MILFFASRGKLGVPTSQEAVYRDFWIREASQRRPKASQGVPTGAGRLKLRGQGIGVEESGEEGICFSRTMKQMGRPNVPRGCLPGFLHFQSVPKTFQGESVKVLDRPPTVGRHADEEEENEEEEDLYT